MTPKAVPVLETCPCGSDIRALAPNDDTKKQGIRPAYGQYRQRADMEMLKPSFAVAAPLTTEAMKTRVERRGPDNRGCQPRTI